MSHHSLGKYSSLLKNFSFVNSELFIGQCSLIKLIESYQTPLYIYNGKSIENSYYQAKQAFSNFEVFYSVKANPSLTICTLLRKLGAGAEVASGGELLLALKAGFCPSKIIFAGPAKTDEEIALAIKTGIASINAESFNELSRIQKISCCQGKVANVCLRINTNYTRLSMLEVMVGGASRFGIDEEQVVDAIHNFNSKNINIVGIHIYTASQILDSKIIVSNLTKLISIVDRLKKDKILTPSLIIFGGGLGVPYSPDEKSVDIDELEKEIKKIFEAEEVRELGSNTRIIVELGKFLVAESGIFLTKVIDTKISRGKKFIATDGGLNSFFRPIYVKANHPTFVVNKLNRLESEIVDIGGPICTPLDIIATSISVPQIEVGDIIGFFKAGAYGLSMSPINFLSHPRPAEIFIQNDCSYLIQKRGSMEDCFNQQQVPTWLV